MATRKNFNPLGTITTNAATVDGVDFYHDRQHGAIVGWFPSVPNVCFEGDTVDDVCTCARDWFRAQVAACVKNTAREYPKADTVARVVKGFASSVLRDREGVIAWGPTPTAVRCFAAAWLVCVPAR